ncbi:MAG: DUF4350 domain-containing protein [Deltaproteobacteria bacterium]|nr:DUF4350 domain-containing protein [Deltaproteobacteria bacterium]
MSRLGRAAALLALFVFAGLLLLLASGGQSTSRATSDRGPEGTAAAAGVLERLGYEVTGLSLGLHVLPRTPSSLLVLSSPPGLVAWPPLTDGDADHLLNWADGGGVVMHFSDRQDALLDALGLEVDATALPRRLVAQAERLATPTRPAGWTQGGPLALAGRAGFSSGVAEPLFVVGDVVVASLHRRGLGAVLVIADPTVVSNASLSLAGNLDFLVSVAHLGVPAGAPVLFDDLHAGGGDGHGVIAYARRAGAGGAILLGALALGLLLWRLGARSAAVVPPPEALPVGGAAEYVRALAGLYERSELARHALAVSSRQFRRAVEERARIPWEHEALEDWLATELGASAAAEFRAVRDAFAHQFADTAPEPDAVLRAARLAARFETQWLRRSLGPSVSPTAAATQTV